MDRLLVQKYAGEFKERSLRLRPYYANKLGIKKNGTHISVDDYVIYGVPFEISLHKCLLLSILRPKEIEFFLKEKKGNVSIHFEMDSPFFGRTVKLFMRSVIRKIQVLNEARSYCMIHLDYASVSSDYREILVDSFLEIDRYDAMFDDPKLAELQIEGLLLDEVGCSSTAKFQVDDHPGADSIIARFGLNTLSLFIRGAHLDDKVGDTVTIELSYRDVPVYVEGRIESIDKSTEVPGYRILTLKPERNVAAADIVNLVISRTKENLSKEVS